VSENKVHFQGAVGEWQSGMVLLPIEGWLAVLDSSEISSGLPTAVVGFQR